MAGGLVWPGHWLGGNTGWAGALVGRGHWLGGGAGWAGALVGWGHWLDGDTGWAGALVGRDTGLAGTLVSQGNFFLVTFAKIFVILLVAKQITYNVKVIDITIL